MFAISFYIFSSLLSYTDFKKFIVPNNILIAMSIMLIVFGIFESKIYISSIVLTLIVLLFFIAIILLKPQMILGGGDIKYMMVVAFYLGLQPFALFLVITGLLQSFALLYVQNIKKRKIAPMVPMMFLSVIIVEALVHFGIYPFRF
jgi:leader peptidase (prepilin peptidase)/N-methyltransferase